eukprot:14057087-Heterocapsa_arctica.AAC.1
MCAGELHQEPGGGIGDPEEDGGAGRPELQEDIAQAPDLSVEIKESCGTAVGRAEEWPWIENSNVK